MEICTIVSKNFSVCPGIHPFPKVCIVPFKVLDQVKHRPCMDTALPRAQGLLP